MIIVCLCIHCFPPYIEEWTADTSTVDSNLMDSSAPKLIM